MQLRHEKLHNGCDGPKLMILMKFSKTKKEFEISLMDFCECFNVFTHRSMERFSLQSRNKYAVVFRSAMGQLYCA